MLFIDTFISNSELKNKKMNIKNKELDLLHLDYVQCIVKCFYNHLKTVQPFFLHLQFW
jgi:hypothetical protein